MKKKRQHIIPNCYLKSWCDPRTPPGHQPFIWRISKDGALRKNKSPEKSFTASDMYTIKLPDGRRSLIVEDTLAGIEDAFVQTLKRVRRKDPLNALHKARLCLFATAMLTRTIAFGKHWKRQMEELHQMVVAAEEAHNAEPRTSNQTAAMVEHAHQQVIGISLETAAPLLFQMPMTILVADDKLDFITSDNPCVWFNPKWYKLPPFYRSPGLAQEEIEITLPLTPHQLLFISHKSFLPYLPVKQDMVDELNRRTRFFCNEEFVSWKGDTRPCWLDRGQEPEDTWEKSEEGRKALAQQERYNHLRAEWEQQHGGER